MTASPEHVLLGDIGATNARFCLLDRGVLGPVECIEVTQFPTFGDAVDRVMSRHLHGRLPQSALFAVAGPVDGGRCSFTNCSWTVDGPEVQDRFQLTSVRILNDFEATALSLPFLAGHDVFSLGGGRQVLGAPMVVLGPGSGLGVAALVGHGLRRIVIATEGGHATFSGASRREDAVLDHIRQRFGHASAERVLSGPGLENLYCSIAALDVIKAPSRNAAEITDAAVNGNCPTSRAALDMFCAMLGGFAGNVALTYGALGGVYIAGGIAPRILTYLAASQFRYRFEEKGRLRTYLEAIQSRVIVHPAATFLGLKCLADGRAGSEA
jgi:glucokinase